MASYKVVFQDGWTPLHIAAQYGHDSTVESLIKCGADINAAEVVSCLCTCTLLYFNT